MLCYAALTVPCMFFKLQMYSDFTHSDSLIISINLLNKVSDIFLY